MMRRTGFKPKWPAKPVNTIRAPAVTAKPDTSRFRAMQRVSAEVRPCAKESPLRSRVLLDLAKGKRCLLMAVEACRGLDGSTTVACHENEGKGMALKSSDSRSVWGCVHCHEWYDRSGAPRAEKRRVFAAAYERQVEEWGFIADGPAPMVDRQACAAALAYEART